MAKRRIMREFVIKELSAVDRPAQKPALATIMKRDDSEDLDKAWDESKHPRDEGGKWTDGAGGSSAAGNRDTRERKAAEEYLDRFYVDSDLARENLTHVAEDLTAHLRGKFKSLSEEAVDQIVQRSLRERARNYLKEGDDDTMTDAEKRQLDELQKRVKDLTDQLDAATKGDVAKRAADLQAKLEKAETEAKALADKLAKVEADAKVAKAKSEMSDDEKNFFEGLEDEEKEEFEGASPEDRAKKMKKARDADPVVYKSADGTEFRKSDDARLIAMAKRADENEKIAKAEREARELAEFGKRADDELQHFSEDVAKRDDKVAALRAIAKMDDGPREALTKMLSVGAKAVAAAFNSIGHRNEEIAKSAEAFTKRVSEVQARDKCNRLEALQKAQREYPAEFKAYQEAGGN